MRSRLLSSSTLTIALLAVCVSLAGCAAPAGSAAQPPTSAAAASTTRVVSTSQGDVAIPTAPKRVVLLNYALAGYLFDLEVPVVGMTSEATNTVPAFADSWASDARAAGTEFVPWSGEGFDLQAILALQPDLIVAGGLGYPLMLATKAYSQLSAIAPTIIVSGSLTQWQQQFEFLASDVFGTPQVYADALAAYEKKVAEVRNSITPPAGDSAFLSFTADQRPFVLIEDRGLPRIFTDLGFHPAKLFATGNFTPYTAGGDSFEISTEQAGQLLTQDSLFVFGFNAETVDIATLRQNPVWASLPAFTANRVYQFPYWAQRADFDESMALLTLIQQQFMKRG